MSSSLHRSPPIVALLICAEERIISTTREQVKFSENRVLEPLGRCLAPSVKRVGDAEIVQICR